MITTTTKASSLSAKRLMPTNLAADLKTDSFKRKKTRMDLFSKRLSIRKLF